jgi:fatty-acyl-CoA synthase
LSTSDPLTALPVDAQLDERARRVAAGLAARGVGRGDRVALWLPNVPAWLELEFALARLGAIAVAVNTRFRAREAQDVVERSGARLLVRHPAYDRVDADLVELGPAYDALLEHPPLGEDRADPDAPCNVFTSSGTTGLPKLVVHRQGGIVAHSRAVADAFGYRAPDAVVLAMLPLCGVFGFNTALGALAAGRPLVLLEEFDADAAVALIERHRVTHTNGSLEMLRRILACAPVPSLREAGFAAFSGNARALVDAGDRLGKRFYQCYGSTEVQALMARAPADAPPAQRAVAGGPPISDAIEVRVGDELEVRGPNVMAGYLDDAEPDFTADGFLRTGDVAVVDPEGYIKLVDRTKDLVKSGGEWISSVDLENALMGHAAVKEACVVGVPHPKWQERPVAAVVLKEGRSATAEELRAFLATQFAKWQLPDAFVFLEAIPRTSVGKFKKLALREQFADWNWER